MKKLTLLLAFCCTMFAVSAQESFRQKFLEANTLIEENQFNVALPIWLDLHNEQPDNFNVNYKVGLCYIHSTNDKTKALTYLVKAVQNTTKNYDPYSTSEKKSPVESYFYLARAYHIHYELDNAMLKYNAFKENIGKKHYLFDEVDHHIQQCKDAKIAVANPVNIKVKNMGDVINSPDGDYSPALSIDESTIYFTSKRIRPDSSNYYVKDISDGEHFEDIYVSHKYDGKWTEPKLVGINTEGHEATVNLSADGQTLFIYKDDDGDGNIYTSSLEGENWTFPQKIGSDVNKESRETHAHISPKGDFLYFVSDRKGGSGGQDIYVCKRLPNGEWAKAQNMGGVLNTPYDEDGVFVHPDGKTMYFSSRGHNSIGGFDIFYSTVDDAGIWSKPINMGYPVNSTDDDVFFVTSADGKRGYFSSFKEDGYGSYDIYQISLEDAAEKPLTLLTGFIKVLGQDELPDDAMVTVTNNENGDRPNIYKPRKKDGKFSIILNPGVDYHIEYSAGGFTQEEDLYIPPISAYQEINRGIDLQDVIFGEEPIKDTTQEPTKNTVKDPIKDLSENDELTKLKAVITTLNLQIADLKDQLKKSKKETLVVVNDGNDAKIVALESVIDDLKKQLDAMAKKKVENINTIYTPSEDIIASYQEYFDYNVKSIKTQDSKYIDMIAKAVNKAKTGKVTIDIESSASKVPTKTFGSNSKLAYTRAQAAKAAILKSLKSKGANLKNININKVSSNVNGPQYNGDFQQTGLYEKFQYVIIKIR